MGAEDFYPYLMDGQMQLWVAINDGELDASMVTQIIPYPRKRVLRITKRWALRELSLTPIGADEDAKTRQNQDDQHADQRQPRARIIRQ